MTKTVISNFIVIFLFVLLETAILSNINVLPAIPDFVLIVVLYIALFNGSVFGETSGFVSGLLLDFLSAAPLGLNSLLRTIIGAVAGVFHKTLNTSGFFIPALIGFFATLIKYLLTLCISFFFPDGSIVVYFGFSNVFLFELAMNTFFTPLIFSFLSIFSSFIVYKSENMKI